MALLGIQRNLKVKLKFSYVMKIDRNYIEIKFKTIHLDELINIIRITLVK